MLPSRDGIRSLNRLDKVAQGQLVSAVAVIVRAAHLHIARTIRSFVGSRVCASRTEAVRPHSEQEV